MDLKSFVNDLVNNYVEAMISGAKKDAEFINSLLSKIGDVKLTPGEPIKKLNLTPAQQIELKKQVAENIYKNKNRMKTAELENILKSYVSADKIERFHNAVKNRESITKKEFSTLLQNNTL